MPHRATVEAASYDRNIAHRFTPQRTLISAKNWKTLWGASHIFWLERFSPRRNQFNPELLQCLLGFNRMRDGYRGSAVVKSAPSDYGAAIPSIDNFRATVVFETAFDGERAVGFGFRPAAARLTKKYGMHPFLGDA